MTPTALPNAKVLLTPWFGIEWTCSMQISAPIFGSTRDRILLLNTSARICLSLWSIIKESTYSPLWSIAPNAPFATPVSIPRYNISISTETRNCFFVFIEHIGLLGSVFIHLCITRPVNSKEFSIANASF